METITGWLTGCARRDPEVIGLEDEREHLTYAQWEAESNRVAAWLSLRGVGRGDRVLMLAGNSVRWVVALLGALKVGAVPCPLHPHSPVARVRAVMERYRPTALVVDAARMRLLPPVISGMSLLILDGTGARGSTLSLGWEGLAQFSSLPSGPVFVPAHDELAMILSTSGSSSAPSGVMLPHGPVTFAVGAINQVLGNGVDDRILCGLPFSFDYGLYQIFLALESGARLVVRPDFGQPLSIPRLLVDHQITGLPLVPSLAALLLRSRLLERVELPHLRYLTSTGDVFPPAHVRQLRRLLPHVSMVPMYGLTECKRVTMMPSERLEGREGSVGLPLPGTRIWVEDEAGQRLPPGQVGELMVEGPHVMTGYWEEPERGRERFRAGNSGERTLCTGDLFRMDEEGFCYFVGRRESFLKSRGERVSPAEVEAFLCGVEGVAEAGVVGVSDPVRGQAVAAFICSPVPLSQKAEVVDRIRACCLDGLPVALCPLHIDVNREGLPKTENGKIDRHALTLRAQQMYGLSMDVDEAKDEVAS